MVTAGRVAWLPSDSPRDLNDVVAAPLRSDPAARHFQRLRRGSPGRRPAARPGAAHPLERLARHRLARPPAAVQDRSGLPPADDPATREPDPRAGDRPPLHHLPPQLLGRAQPVARSARRSGCVVIRAPARARRAGLRAGVPPRLSAQRLSVRGHGEPRDRPGDPLHRQPAAAASHRPRFEASDHRVGLAWPRRRRPGLRQRRIPLYLDGGRLGRLGHQPDRPADRRSASLGLAPRRRSSRARPELRRAPGQPVRRSPRGAAGDLGLRPAQSLAVELRPSVGPALGGQQRAGRVGAGVSDPARRQLRLERRRGGPRLPRASPGGARPDPAARGRSSS